MRRSIGVLVAVALMGLPIAAANAGKPAMQHVEGSITAPQPFPADGTCIYRGQRALMATSNGAAPNGVVGYTFEVDPKTANKPFKLEVTGDGVGMDISFYTEMGDATDPTTAPANVGFETPGPGGEAGKVPAGYPIAFVCMTDGANGSFMYMAGKGMK